MTPEPRNRQSHFLVKYFATSKGRQRDTPTTVIDRQQQQKEQEQEQEKKEQEEEQEQNCADGGRKTGT